MPRKPISRRDESDLAERMTIGAGHQATIGDDLRAAREARGEDLRDIAAQLRIRFAYLEAIENGSFDALPGPTYAIGFVRAYARYLRLNAEEMIARFKIEAAGIDAPAELTFPEPMSESRVPRGGLVVIAILLAVAAYGGWYYLSTRDMTVADMVPPAPSDMAGVSANDTANLPPEIAELAPPPPSELPETPSDSAAAPAP
ncbi:MAG TPA: helix-turn-helix domain-containing protein, partial [Alphaproteobacteria bacterium]|nr:helix-turn-helix domain-containing protein [Alphaproteobacteria bacterium]